MADVIIPKKSTRRKPNVVYGIGINDIDYQINDFWVNPNKKSICPFYERWRGMIKRCYCKADLEKFPCYIGCTVAPEWHRFSVFRNWMEKQNWKGMQLDKDFLSDSRVYSPDTCVFIPGWLNAMFIWHKGTLPRGVSDRNYGYVAMLQTPNTKRTYLGHYKTKLEACTAYVNAKVAYVRSRYTEVSKIDSRLVSRCENKIEELYRYLKEIE
jgi:hypothetical protein